MTDQDATERYTVPTGAPEVGAYGDTAEATPTAAPTERVSSTRAPGSGRPGRSALRWLVALVVSVLVVGTAAAGTMLLTADAGDPDVLAWAPADSVAYVELRVDLPGSQRAELAKVMSAFPGFADQAAFDTKLSEALDQLVKRASDGKHNYAAEIQPWFGGQLSVSVPTPPTSAQGAKDARALLLVSVKDAAKASAWAAQILAESGATSGTEKYGGVDVTTVTPKAGGGAEASMTAAYAVLGPVLALGDAASVKAAIDTKGSSGIGGNAQFKAAKASLSGDRLAFAYIDTAAIMAAAKSAAAAATGDAPASMLRNVPALLTDLSAPWTSLAVRAVDNALVVETRTPHIEKLGPANATESKIAALVPSDTVFLATGHDVGASLERLRSLAAADPSLKDGVKQLDDTLALVGGVPALVDWMGDAGIAVTRSGDAVAGGLVVTPTDAAAATRLLTQLRGFLGFLGPSASITDETYAGATITRLELSNLGSLAGALGGGGLPGVGGAPGASPSIPSAIPAKVSIAYTVTDGAVVFGSGTDFVKSVLDARTGGSLATNDRFVSLLARADKVHGSLSWIDIRGIRDLVERQVPAKERADYETNAKPYLQAFDALIGTNVPGNDVDRGTLIVRVANQ